jgi:hypothetical protein
VCGSLLAELGSALVGVVVRLNGWEMRDGGQSTNGDEMLPETEWDVVEYDRIESYLNERIVPWSTLA